jgi:hypothetical protein
MSALSKAGAALLPTVLIACFLFPVSTRILDFRFNHLGADQMEAVPLALRIGAAAFALIPTAVASYGLLALGRLFECFARGQIFTGTSMLALSQVTKALVLNVVLAFFMQAPISLLMTWHLGHGHREISLGFGSDDVSVLFLAGVAFVIARVMAEARRVADENASFV